MQHSEYSPSVKEVVDDLSVPVGLASEELVGPVLMQEAFKEAIEESKEGGHEPTEHEDEVPENWKVMSTNAGNKRRQWILRFHVWNLYFEFHYHGVFLG